MPFKSKAQRRKFAHLLVEGKIKDTTYEEWNRSTGRKTLPERLHPRKKARDEKPAQRKKRATSSGARSGRENASRAKSGRARRKRTRSARASG